MASNRQKRERDQLRAKILESAQQIIHEEGYQALTIRKIATRIEYSPMALYNHFADKTAILVALARNVFARLEEALPKPGKDPLVTLRKVLLAYIEFGLEHPDEYQLVFMTCIPGQTPATPQTKAEEVPDHTGGRQAFERLLRSVEACIGTGKVTGHPFQIATALWAGIHGAVSIQITQTEFPFGPRKAFAETLVHILIQGIKTV